LVGTTWVRDGTTITLIFGDGSLSGNAGCNDYSAGYTAQTEPGVANSLKIEQISATDKVCDANVMTREQSYLGTLQSASSYIINGIRLTITTAGEQLIFYPSTVKP
jgi:heat shock protein HslJ